MLLNRPQAPGPAGFRHELQEHPQEEGEQVNESLDALQSIRQLAELPFQTHPHRPDDRLAFHILPLLEARADGVRARLQRGMLRGIATPMTLMSMTSYTQYALLRMSSSLDKV